MNTNRIYEDKNGIQYRCVGFQNNQFKMKIIHSPYAEISEGVIEWMDELPPEANNEQPLYGSTEI